MHHKLHSNLLITLTTLALAATSALAIHPSRWVHDTEADFDPGKSSHVVVTNLGDVKLATGSTLQADLAELEKPVSIINDMQALGDEVYVAAGPEGRLLTWRDGKITDALELPESQIFALDISPAGHLLVAVSGEPCKLMELRPDGPVTLLELPEVRYIWDMRVVDDKVFLATGIEGQLLEVTLAELKPVVEKPIVDEKQDVIENEKAAPEVIVWPAGVRLILDTRQANLLCLASDAQNRLYVGSDTDGLVYRVTLGPKADADGRLTPQAFVLFDAPEPEIGALYVRPDGTVFAGTADAEQAHPGRLVALGDSPQGRPDGQQAPKADPAEPPAAPVEPGDLPNVPPKPEPQEPAEKAEHANETPAANAPAIHEKPPINSAAHHDALRQLIEARLLATDGKPTPPAQDPDAAPQFGPPRMPMNNMPSAGGGPGGSDGGMGDGNEAGNAVYRIDSLGFVQEVFRESVMILRIVPDPANADRLLVATGSEGQLYRVDPAAEETTILVDLEPQQIPAMIAQNDGRVLLGTANPATLVLLEKGFAKEGEFTSPVLDATQISLWGKLHLTADLPGQTAIKVQTRSGNVGDSEDEGWSSWLDSGELKPDATVGALAPRPLDVLSPPARFLQYRLTLAGDGAVSPVAQKVELAYVMPNLKPVIASVHAAYAQPQGGGPGQGPGGKVPVAAGEVPEAPATLQIEWQAHDPNEDQLKYTLEYQPAGSDKWLPLAEDVSETSHEWAVRRVPDGRYLLRVTASDGPDNPAGMARTVSRLSDPVMVDNTPPAIEIVKQALQGRILTLALTVTDKLSIVQSLHFAVDTTKDWQQALPDDLIFDSTKETVAVKIADLASGPHVVTLRATDAQGNAKYESLMIDVK